MNFIAWNKFPSVSLFRLNSDVAYDIIARDHTISSDLQFILRVIIIKPTSLMKSASNSVLPKSVTRNLI